MTLKEFVEQRFGSPDAGPKALKRIEYVQDETNRHVLRAVLAGIGLTLADFTDYVFFRAMGANPGSGKKGNDQPAEIGTYHLAIQNRSGRALVSDISLWTQGVPYYQIKNDLAEFHKGNPQYGDPMKEAE